MSTKTVESSAEKTKAGKEELTGKNGEMPERDLNKVTGGAYPTAINNQITESVT
ncbi:MAG: hypothetical protein RIN56_10965 [Sporomusaceae bacterium]|nr:hypothetical protein [Sporomusaceae bacterium]